MDKNAHKAFRRQRRHKGIRGSVVGTPDRPRLSIYKSLKHIHAQVIDDLKGHTLASASSVEESLKGDGGGKTGNSKSAAAVGKAVAARAKQAGVTAVTFDRGGFKFHGRVKALADAARAEGLKF